MTKKNKKDKQKLANPVTSLANKLATVFEGDPDYVTCFSYDEYKLRVGCRVEGMAEDLASICQTHFDIGNLYLDVEFCYVIGEKGRGKKKTPIFSEPVNATEKITDPKKFSKMWKQCFEMTNSYGDIKTVMDPFGQRWWYIMSAPTVLQYDNDDELNYWGLTSTLPETVFFDLLELPKFVKLSTIKKPAND